MKIIITVKDTDNIVGLKEDISMRLEGVADILRIDTADVVPKSEVDKLVQDNEDLRNVLANTINQYRNCEAEVAREIFEEIDKCRIISSHGSCGFLIYDIQALRKKYAEKK